MPDKIMRGNDVLAMQVSDGSWEINHYVKDKSGRTWIFRVKAPAPEIMLGEPLKDGEWVDE